MPDVSAEEFETVLKFLLALGATIVLLMPGYIAGAALRGGLPRPTRTEREFLAATVATGLLVHLFALPWTVWLVEQIDRDGVSAHFLGLITWSSVVLLLGPAIVGNRLGALSERTSPVWLVAILRETGIGLGVRVHHAWDWASRYWVLLSVEAPSVAQAESQAAKLVRQAAKAAGLPAWPLVGIEVVPAEDLASRPRRELPTLVGTAEAARMLGVSKTRIKQIMQENRRFPVPVAHLAAGPVWIEDEIREFAKLRRTPGRPSKDEVDREQARMEDIAGVRARQRYRLAPEDRL